MRIAERFPVCPMCGSKWEPYVISEHPGEGYEGPLTDVECADCPNPDCKLNMTLGELAPSGRPAHLEVAEDLDA